MIVFSVQLLYSLVCCGRRGADLTWFAGGAIAIPRVTLLELDVVFMVDLIIKLQFKAEIILLLSNVQENEEKAAEL